MPETEKQLKNAVEPLVIWFSRVKRRLPWRDEPSPYHVWLSEIMLQQTRIEAVIPYYIRFLGLYPTVFDLAAADDDRLMKAWEGLGYYSRARNLKKTAVLIAADGGEFPRDKASLMRLPGIGEYTAGAIASICFGRAEPAVDGNVLRVLARYTDDVRDVMLPAVKKEMTAALRAVYPPGNDAGLLTQALMELGETVCLPNTVPLCDRCPIADTCMGKKSGRAPSLPVRGKKKERRTETMTVFVLYDPAGRRYAIRKRPDTGLLASLYEFPHVSGFLDDAAAEEYLRREGLLPSDVRLFGEGHHLFTHIEWKMRGIYAAVGAPSDAFLWATPAQLAHEYAVASAFRMCLRETEKRGRVTSDPAGEIPGPKRFDNNS